MIQHKCMKNYEKYPHMASKGDHVEFCKNFWKDHPKMKDETIPELQRLQWAIIMYGRWWVGEEYKTSL